MAKIDYILKIVSTSPDSYGNVYTGFVFTDCQTGYSLIAQNAPKSNIEAIRNGFNGYDGWNPHFYNTYSEVSKKDYKWIFADSEYCPNNSDDIREFVEKWLKAVRGVK